MLAELPASGQAPTAATARLLRCCAKYASEVLLDYQHFLGYEQQLLEVYRAWHGEEDHPDDVAWSLNNVGVAYDKLGKYEQALEHLLARVAHAPGPVLGRPPRRCCKSLNNVGVAYDKAGQVRTGAGVQAARVTHAPGPVLGRPPRRCCSRSAMLG